MEARYSEVLPTSEFRRIFRIEAELRQAGQQFFVNDLKFDPRKIGTKATMRSGIEGKVRTVGPVQVEFAGPLISARINAVSDVVSAGFKTTEFPVARAGAIFQAAIMSGKFHGITCPATPNEETCLPGKAYSSLSAHPA